MNTPRVHVVIPTHTDRHLRRTLLGLAGQTRPVASVTVSGDTDDPAILDVVQRVHDETGLPLLHTCRARHEQPRRAQTRNNGIRTLLEIDPDPEDHVLFLDGDCLPAVDLVETHAACALQGELVIGYFIALDETTTNQLRDDALDLAATPGQLEQLRTRQRRARRQLLLRRLGLAKAHKPKAVTGNLGVRLRRIIEINGFDEAYMDWGFEDDDFTRRLHAAKSRPVLAHATALVFHQWHPTLKQADWTESDSARRFRASAPMRCEHGIEHPVPQHEVSSTHLID